jgi:hypothetical protein
MDISYEQKLSFDFLTTQKIIKKSVKLTRFLENGSLLSKKTIVISKN